MWNPIKYSILLSFYVIAMADVDIDNKLKPFRAEVQSCKGCALNRLPEVKSFIYLDLPKYPDVTFKPIVGANPDLVLFNSDDTEIERIDLKPFTKAQCNDLLESYGYKMKQSIDEFTGQKQEL
ncbi:selenoprotein M [Nilaparvata lugens]|uniref:selenoprotein M n=1 Tax=Nilaparvata lugens TaxID=108931 RepID=UPI00193E1219|nr:selenoprotein M [Nilaparvata lugens]